MGELVFVSGATGFIASHTIGQLLTEGHHVRASVRTSRTPQDTAYLRNLPGAADRLEIVEADLLEPGAFDAHVQGCTLVMHMASPYVLSVGDPQRDLIDPAVSGTRSMLAACAQAPSVRRVILTSSMAAITDEPENRVLTESDWNDTSTLTRNPYYLSKTLAERAAWSFVEAERPRWDLVAINPFLVIGPSLSPSLNTSNKVIADLLNGVFPGIVSLCWGVVDVRDVAAAHVLAMHRGATGRYICAAGTITMREMVTLLRRNGYSAYRLPTRGLDNAVGDILVSLASYLQANGVGQYLRTHIGRNPRFDNARIRQELGLQFRPIDETVTAAAADVVRWGHTRAR